MYCIKSKNIRGYVQEELRLTYSEAIDYALECKDSQQYSVITILKYDLENDNYFLHRIVK